MTTPLLLGVDGGGTTTTAWLADAEGQVLGDGTGGPSNLQGIPAEAALAALDEAIAAAFADAGLAQTTVAAACLGLAGSDRDSARSILEGWAGRMRLADRLVLATDADLVLAAGTPDGNGVAVIAGTGSIAVGRSPDGRKARAGGWGSWLGDEGSAFAVAVAGLRLALRRFDGREALGVLKAKPKPKPTGPDALTRRLCEALGVADPSGFVDAIGGGRDVARIAALAPEVVAAADDDPDVLGWVLEPAGFELGRAALAVARALDWQGAPLPLAMAGGFLLGAEPVAGAMLGYLRRFAGLEIVPARVPEPVLGAVALAKQALKPEIFS
ncbi:MAG TPA: BadF/BadG/BcrA/BcrD ATPase family protein [Isosphaeraceae bacterium]|jgi:N-acetylglucosamine kinase-like BadF-type ATPase|nr:BadF/BadG/BcrA/BcrD ATPase family protein [Isosphaeraceae bacterium]